MPSHPPLLPRNWIAVASAEHARRGCAEPARGYMQVCHGKRAPLKRVSPGDRVTCYAPTLAFGARDKYQHFVSIGVAQSGEPYPFDIGGGFVPFRRDVTYLPAQEVPVAPLLDQLEFARERQHWGYKLRFGLFEISDHDMQVIANAMQADSIRLGLAV